MDMIEARYLPWHADLLEQALRLKRDNRLAHAVMLDTVHESSIADLAQYLAQLLLCDSPEGIEVCDRCEACRLMRAGTYADFSMVVREVDEKSKKISKNIKIEQIRQLIHELSLTPQFGRIKIAIIYPAESMNKASANALLKTLEEPAAGVFLLLATHNRGRVPVTLRSRCQSWSISPPDTTQALEWLTRQGMDTETANKHLLFAQGDPVLALDLQQQDYASTVEQFKTRLARFLRGELSVVEIGRDLLSHETSLVRRLIQMTLNAYCLQTSGIDAAANPVDGADPVRAQDLLELRQRAQNQMQIEENNLDFQIQLEDVLISLKQILTRRSV